MFERSDRQRAVCAATIILPRLVILALVVLCLLSVPVRAVTPLTTVKVGKTPGEVAVNAASHIAYVVNTGANSVTLIDTQKLTVKGTLAVGTAPWGIAVNPVLNAAYVANTGSGSITPISGVTALAPWVVGGTPAALVVDTVLSQLYVMDPVRKQVEILNAVTGAVLGTIPMSLQPTAIALNIATHAVFVACTGSSGSVVAIDGASKQKLMTYAVPTGTTSISVNPVADVVLVASQSTNTLSFIDVASGTITTTSGTTAANARSTAYASGFFYAADTGDGDIFFTNAIGWGLGNAYTTFLTGATGIALNPSTNQLVVLYGKSDGLEVIDLLNPLFSENYHLLTAGRNVAGAAFDPASSRLFVSSSLDNTVTVFDVSPQEVVDAYEGSFDVFSATNNFVDTNPATGMVYTARMNTLFAINEAAAGKGSNGQRKDAAGVTAIQLASPYSACVAVNVATNTIYVGDSVGAFYSVDGATNVARLISTVPPTADIRSVAVDSATNQIIAWDTANFAVYVLDGATNAVVKTVPITPTSNGGMVVDPTRNLAYVLAGKSLDVIDPSAGTIAAKISLPDSALWEALNQNQNRLYVALAHAVIVIDTSTNTVVTDLAVPYSILAIGLNSYTGTYYVGMVDGTTGTLHVSAYSPGGNTLVKDFTSTAYPAITGITDIKANPLTNLVYVASDSPSGTSMMAVIDERGGAVSGVAPLYDSATELGLDLGSNVLAAAGVDYTNLFFPTSDVTGGDTLPIRVAGSGVVDSQTIATTPIFRTRNSTPTFTITAQSNFGTNASNLIPKHAYYQVDGWQGAWKLVTLTAKPGTNTSTGKVKLSTAATGRHIMYLFAADGDVATVQAALPSGNSIGNSPVISPIGSVVFTVEK
jgi:YVTN family beta-propeller protein